ncbi:hypothetical protein ACHAWF_008289 [Thalassiosira exigua]
MAVKSITPSGRDSKEARSTMSRREAWATRRKNKNKNKCKQWEEGIQAEENVNDERASPSSIADAMPFFQKECDDAKEVGSAVDERVGTMGRDSCKDTSFDAKGYYDELLSRATSRENPPNPLVLDLATTRGHDKSKDKSDDSERKPTASFSGGGVPVNESTPVQHMGLHQQEPSFRESPDPPTEDPTEKNKFNAAVQGAAAHCNKLPAKMEGQTAPPSHSNQKFPKVRLAAHCDKPSVQIDGGNEELKVDWATGSVSRLNTEREKSRVKYSSIRETREMSGTSQREWDGLGTPQTERADSEASMLHDQLSTIRSMTHLNFSEMCPRRPAKLMEVMGNILDNKCGIPNGAMEIADNFMDNLTEGLRDLAGVPALDESFDSNAVDELLVEDMAVLIKALNTNYVSQYNNAKEDLDGVRKELDEAKETILGIEAERDQLRAESDSISAQVLVPKDNDVNVETVLSLRRLADLWESEALTLRRQLSAEREAKNNEIEALRRELDEARSSKAREGIWIAQRAQFLDSIRNLKCRADLMLKGEGSTSLGEASNKKEVVLPEVEDDQYDVVLLESELEGVDVDEGVETEESSCINDVKVEGKEDDKKVLTVQSQEHLETFENLFAKNDHENFIEKSMYEAMEEQNVLASKIRSLKDIICDPREEEKERLRGLTKLLENGHMCALARVEEDNIEAVQELETLKKEMASRIEGMLEEVDGVHKCRTSTRIDLDDAQVLARRQHEWLRAMAMVLGSLTRQVELAREKSHLPSAEQCNAKEMTSQDFHCDRESKFM